MTNFISFYQRLIGHRTASNFVFTESGQPHFRQSNKKPKLEKFSQLRQIANRSLVFCSEASILLQYPLVIVLDHLVRVSRAVVCVIERGVLRLERRSAGAVTLE